jgi:hypothetical protein
VILSGCFGTETKQTLKIKETLHIDKKTDKVGTIQFDGITPDHYKLSASGNNSTININIPTKKPINVQETKDEKSETEVDASFSFDSMIESVSLGFRLLILLAVIVIMVLTLYFIKKTIGFKFLQASVQGSVKYVGKNISLLTDSLMDADPLSPEYKVLQGQLRSAKDELTDLNMQLDIKKK